MFTVQLLYQRASCAVTLHLHGGFQHITDVPRPAIGSINKQDMLACMSAVHSNLHSRIGLDQTSRCTFTKQDDIARGLDDCLLQCTPHAFSGPDFLPQT
jgi:hypothetical protein